MMDFNLKEISEYVHINIKSKTNEDPEDAKLRRLKDIWLFFSTMSSIALVFIFCFVFILLNSDSEFVGIALNGIIGLSMALAGYYVRGKTS